MGVVAADFDNDADFDLFLTHLRDETNTFYRNLGAGTGFEDRTTQVGDGRSELFQRLGDELHDVQIRRCPNAQVGVDRRHARSRIEIAVPQLQRV